MLDGELDAQQASSLRERIAREPALALRLAVFERVGGALRALPAREVPADLAARLHARLAAQPRQQSAPASSATATRLLRAPASRSRRRWTAAAALSAAAAALALYFAVPSAVPPSRTPQVAETPPSLLASAAEDELGIALYYDELLDLEMLEQLELLEILAAIEEAEQG